MTYAQTPCLASMAARFIVTVAFVATCICAPLHGQPATQPAVLPPPATIAATLPTTRQVVIDATTPKGAVRTFAIALNVGDARALQAVVYRADETERRMADATIGMAVALATFRQASVAQFGKAEVDRTLDNPDAKHANALERIASAVETIEGDTATVGQAGEPPVILRRTDGQWQIVIGALSPSDNPKLVEDRIRGIERQATVVSELALDIQADRHRTMREVVTVLHGQMMKAAVESKETNDPSVITTTGPADNP